MLTKNVPNASGASLTEWTTADNKNGVIVQE